MNHYVFIAVNFNGSNYTKSYIESIHEIILGESDEIKIIVVDNYSSETDYQSLGKYCSTITDVRLIRLNENVGYFKGLNQGILSVNKKKNTVFIVGNNDLTFDKDFIINLKKINYDRDVFVIAPNIITKEGRQQNPHVIDRVSSVEKWKTSIYYSNYYIGQLFRVVNQSLKRVIKKKAVLKNNIKQMKIKRGIGACYVLTPNFTKKFEKLDDSVFMWGEEAVLSNQIESENGSILYDPSIIVHHHESASVTSIESKKRYYMVKESHKVYKKYL